MKILLDFSSPSVDCERTIGNLSGTASTSMQLPNVRISWGYLQNWKNLRKENRMKVFLVSSS